MVRYWIWLSTRRNLRMQTAVALIKAFGDAEVVYGKGAEDYINIEGIRKPEVESLCDKSLDAANEIRNSAFICGISILTYNDEEYPERLRNIPDPPMVLYYLGKMMDFDNFPGIAVVGTRRPSVYGCFVAHQFGQQISECGGVVISGLAVGIDAQALSGAVSRKLPSAAVLGCGLDICYPVTTRFIRESIERRGCVLSEHPPGTPPHGKHFPRRNRLISGLAYGVLVVEAPKGSGALITAKHALEQNRDIFAVPGNVGAPNSYGCNELLANGAQLVQYAWDIMKTYQHLFPDRVAHKVGYKDLSKYPGIEPIVMDNLPKQKIMVFTAPPKPRDPLEDDFYELPKEPELPEDAEPEPVAPEPVTPPSATEVQKRSPAVSPMQRMLTERLIPTPGMVRAAAKQPGMARHGAKGTSGDGTDQEELITRVLRNQMLQVDEITEQARLTTGQVLATLTILEVKGVVTRHPGKFYSLTADLGTEET